MRVITTTQEETGLGPEDSTYELITTDSEVDEEVDLTSESGETQSDLDAGGRFEGIHHVAENEHSDDDADDDDGSSSSGSSSGSNAGGEDHIRAAVIADEPGSESDRGSAAAAMPESLLVEAVPEAESESKGAAGPKPEPVASARRARASSSIEYAEQSLQLPSAKAADDEDGKKSLLGRILRAARVLHPGGIVHAGQTAREYWHDTRLSGEGWRSFLMVSVTIFSACGIALWIGSGAAGRYMMAPADTGVNSSASSAAATPVVTSSSTSLSIPLNLSSSLAMASPPLAPNSAVAPFVGFLHDFSDFGASRKNVCSVEVTPSRDVLIKMPAEVKAKWLSKGCMSIGVYRRDEMLKSKFFSVDAGIVIQVDDWDAYGIVNVSVVTNKRPRINETFTVDLGPSLLEGAWEALQCLAIRTAHEAREMTDVLEARASEVSSMLSERALEANAAVVAATRRLTSSFAAGLGRGVVGAAVRVRQVEDGIRARVDGVLAHGEMVESEIKLGVLKAQISSRLWYYKLTGRTGKHDEYRAKAKAHLAVVAQKMAPPKGGTDRAGGAGGAGRAGKKGRSG